MLNYQLMSMSLKINLEVYKNKRFHMKGNYWELSNEIFDRINDTNRQSYVDFMIENPFIAKRKYVNVKACKENQN